MPAPFPDLFALDVRTVLVLLFAGNLALGAMVLLFEWFTGEARHRRQLRAYALARLLQALAWLLMVERTHLPDTFSVLLANNVLLGGFVLESLVALDLGRARAGPARSTHLALCAVAFLVLDVVFLAFRSERNCLAAASAGVGLTMLVPSAIFLGAPGDAGFRRLLGAGNLAFAGVLGARSCLGMVDASLHLYSQGAVQSLTFLMLILILVLSGTVMLLMAKEEADQELRDLATKDPLTGLSNRRAFLEQASRVLAYHQRYGLDVAVLFIDIDHFKAVNDAHGHAGGDQVIRHLARVLRQSIREFDLHCRYGGEEFVLLLPNASRAEGLQVAERIREEVARAGRDLVPAPYTVSVGLATRPGVSKDPLADLLARSDAALYKAKRFGRNRVEVEEGDAQHAAARGEMPA